MKKALDDAFSVFGMVFVVLLIASYFVSMGKVIDNARSFLILFFIVSVVGKYLLDRKKSKKHTITFY
ncbi:hypothetical protein [Listeria aquatica]|uniref:Uncharacterized protein n=1 Tax=Listeria aquatica FSL S10-1188 TaxID=1265818 RepID=W7AUG8_9LIST|nr:hypothetical protein [Listeria aquatica]EUJ17302.1 hypothetical protein MAQA_14120 [Listeria aquatica FSL S10-1188]